MNTLTAESQQINSFKTSAHYFPSPSMQRLGTLYFTFLVDILQPELLSATTNISDLQISNFVGPLAWNFNFITKWDNRLTNRIICISYGNSNEQYQENCLDMPSFIKAFFPTRCACNSGKYFVHKSYNTADAMAKLNKQECPRACTNDTFFSRSNKACPPTTILDNHLYQHLWSVAVVMLYERWNGMYILQI